MITQLEALCTQSAFAQIAYATFKVTATDDDYLAALKTELTSDEAATFSKKWTVKAQFSGDKSGASATVFADSTGKTYLAIRGTEPSLTDFLADGALALGVPKGLNPQFIALKGQITKWMQGADPVLSTCATT